MLNCLKKTVDHEKTEAKTNAPNNKLYIWLLIVTVALTGISLLFKGRVAVFTIWTSISCGALASILVAWLIDAANCRQMSKKTLENRETLFANLYHVFDNGIQIFIFESARINQDMNSKNWYEWIIVSYELTKQHPEQIRLFIRNLMTFFDDIAEQVFAIKGQEAILLDSGIICQEDVLALSTVQKICDTSRATYESKDSDQECFRQFNTYCGLIRGLLDFAPSLRRINDKLVEPRLYLTYLEAEKRTHQSKESQVFLNEQYMEGTTLGKEGESNG